MLQSVRQRRLRPLSRSKSIYTYGMAPACVVLARPHHHHVLCTLRFALPALDGGWLDILYLDVAVVLFPVPVACLALWCPCASKGALGLKPW